MTTPRDLLPAWVVDGDAAPPAQVTLVPWDDGFTPSGCGGRAGRLVRDQPRSTPGALRVVDGAVSRTTADRLYASAVAARVWGVYVPVAQLLADGSEEADAGEVRSEEHERRALARRAARELLVENAATVVSAADWDAAHGVAVWVIASDCDDETEYHLDYAELVRYETNVIVPPVYGATLHVSPLRNADVGCSSESGAERASLAAETADEQPLNELPVFEGGAFYVNRRGLAHYEQYGYKTRRMARKVSTDALEAVSRREAGWVRVPYVYRRGIICDGEFPHFSGRVRSLPAAAEVAAAAPSGAMLAASLPVKRVVVGFNVFPHAIGACVQKYPEHSSAFNKHVKLSQAAARQLAAGGDSSATSSTTAAGASLQQQQEQQQTWSLASVRANPKQAAFLKFLAKKMKEKNVDLASLRGASARPLDDARPPPQRADDAQLAAEAPQSRVHMASPPTAAS
ncbi:hypothetical protein PybrP1_003163 [[Pythium] brassicae (nom. inval.)]|nr:hypothetical protein PybrP1_003163 [[Pythium] brassicae (nom. inval.)]